MQTALETKVAEILRAVDEIQTYYKPVIEYCYRDFLLQNHDPEERAYPDDGDQIRELLIHKNYISQKDIEICIAHDLGPHRTDVNFLAVELLHQSLRKTYAEPIGE